MEYIMRHGGADRLVIVDDGSPDPMPVYPGTTHARHPAQLGIAQAKNTCLALLQDCDLIVLFDDDCVPLDPAWAQVIQRAMDASGVHMLTYLPEAHAQIREGAPSAIRTVGQSVLRSYRVFSSGAMIALTQMALQRIGGMGYYPAPFGFEYAGYLIRAHRAHLCGDFPDPFVTCTGLDSVLWSIDMQGFYPGRPLAANQWGPALTEEHKAQSIQANQITFIAEKTGRLYKPFRVAEGTEVIDG
jgi:hypothetical protein